MKSSLLNSIQSTKYKKGEKETVLRKQFLANYVVFNDGYKYLSAA